MAKVPNIEDIKSCNRADVYLKDAPEKPVIVQGKFIQVSDDELDLVIKTDNQYAVFKSRDVLAFHFYRWAVGGI